MPPVVELKAGQALLSNSQIRMKIRMLQALADAKARAIVKRARTTCYALRVFTASCNTALEFILTFCRALRTARKRRSGGWF